MRESSGVINDLGPYPDVPGYEEAAALDAADPLTGYRTRFVDVDPDLIYLDGNSLGRMPSSTPDVLAVVMHDQWADRLIRSWNEGWWDLQLRLGDKLAPLVGARPGEVIISDSTTVNLYKLAIAAMKVGGRERNRIVTDDLNFPSDLYILDGVARACGGELVVVSSDGVHGPVEALRSAVDSSTALVSLSHTVFKSGYTYDMTHVTGFAHDAGALILWDCSHSVGSVPIDLTGSGADLAVGCTYKYLNGGPGSPAFLYVRTEHQERLHNPITGWWGHREPFEFDLDFEPVAGIRRFHSGTMPILSLAGIESGIDDVLDAGMTAMRAKSEGLSSYLVDQWKTHLEPLGFSLVSPTEPQRRGSHVALAHELAWPITRSMIEEARVIPDFRTPDSIRFGLSPLYTGYVDIHTAVQRVDRLVSEGLHLSHLDDHTTVT